MKMPTANRATVSFSEASGRMSEPTETAGDMRRRDLGQAAADIGNRESGS